MTLATLIVDDEPPARKLLRRLLAAHPDLEIVAEAEDGQDAVDQIRRVRPDLVFLDIQMPGLDGFGVIEAIGAAHMPRVIFVTAYDRHAVRAFETHAVDYLVKPYDETRLARAVERARRGHHRDRLEEMTARLVSLVAAEPLPASRPASRPASPPAPLPAISDRLVVRSTGQVSVVDVATIAWIKAEGSYCRLHVKTGSHLLRESLRSLEARLDASLFRRIHRSALVNVRHIVKLRPLARGDALVAMDDGHELRASRRYRRQLESFFSAG